MAQITNPSTDGIDHINVYSKGTTELGRFLSNFSRTPFQISIGNFTSIEGLIYFLGSFDNRLRSAHGMEAKRLGRELSRGIDLPVSVFQELIEEGMIQKLRNFPRMAKALKDSTLTLSHYYVVNGGAKAVPKWQWQIEIWQKLRERLKAENTI